MGFVNKMECLCTCIFSPQAKISFAGNLLTRFLVFFNLHCLLEYLHVIHGNINGKKKLTSGKTDAIGLMSHVILYINLDHIM